MCCVSASLLVSGGAVHVTAATLMPRCNSAALSAYPAIARRGLSTALLHMVRRHVSRLAARLRDGIMSRLDGVVINGDEERRYAGNMNMSFAYVEGESLIMGLKVSLLAVRAHRLCSVHRVLQLMRQ